MSWLRGDVIGTDPGNSVVSRSRVTGKKRSASADAGASYQPPHDGGGDEAEAEVAADQDEMEVGDPAAGLVAQ